VTWFIIRRMIGMLLTLWVVFTVSWLLMRFVPGGPFSSERQIEPEIEENIRRADQLGLPLPVQYWNQLTAPFALTLVPAIGSPISRSTK
jgi:ABC-type dipeptide/oligopeptide/nickel transport system permease component